MRCPRQRVLIAVLCACLAPAPFVARPAGAQPEAALPDNRDRGRLEFVLLPAGSFLMGSPDREWGSRTDEQQRPVTLTRRFFLGKYEVTQAQWQAVMGRNPSFLYDCPDCPVENVTWYEAVAFCNALSRTLGFAPAYAIRDTIVTWDPAADGIRLPTEAEWEYACRAGTSTVFHTGDCLGTHEANYLGYDPQKGCEKGMWRGQALEIGHFPPNAWELHDMHGNVGEWVWDRHAFPSAQAAGDPRGPDRGAERVIRGGNFRELGRHCRSAVRHKAAPGQRFPWVGLRLARTAPAGLEQP
ncbi:MAG: formylglycine-generating enzyme family protein [bacterium]|nr:formylglycine-generating enzyme family protein [bacterium]